MEAVRSQCNIKGSVIMIPAVYPIYHLSDSLICDTFFTEVRCVNPPKHSRRKAEPMLV